MKSLATGVAAVAAIVAAAAGVTPIAAVSPLAPAVRPAVFGIPLPLDPAPVVPSTDELNGLLYTLADPGVPFAGKSGLVEGGIGPIEAHAADKKVQKAVQNGSLPLSFNVANIAPDGPGAATADVTASGPQLAPRTLNVRFVDQDGWKLSRSSALTVLQMASAG